MLADLLAYLRLPRRARRTRETAVRQSGRRKRPRLLKLGGNMK